MQSPSLALVVFDLAGTTIEDDDVVARCLVDAVAAVGAAVEREDANSVMGLPKPVAIAQLLSKLDGAPPDVSSERVRRATISFQDNILRHYGSPGAIVPIAGVEDVLEDLRAHGAKIAIDTGFASPIVDAILDQLGWIARGLVDTRVASDEVRNGRPAPDLLYEAMRRVGVAEVRTVAKVGDTPADLGEGMSAGCGWTVGVTYGTHSREELADHPHTALIDDVRELPAVLGVESRSRATRSGQQPPSWRRSRPASGA